MKDLPILSKYNFRKGEVLLFDKPLGWSSFKVVYVVRKIIKTLTGEKLKVGHAGTLDPLATGLLIICTGKKTKTISSIQDTEKEYTGTIRLGATTPSFDLETEIDHAYDVSGITEEAILEEAKKLTGEMLQTPPIFSAKKIDGKRAYVHARKGTEVKMRRNLVEVKTFDIINIARKDEFLDLDFRIACSKGTYIRSMAFDLGRLLNNGGHLTSLKRTKIGDFSVADAIDPDHLRVVIEERGFELMDL